MIKKLSLLYLICTILIVLSGVGYIWYEITKYPIPESIDQLENTNTSQISDANQSGQIIPPTKTDCVDELDTECWQTYRNEEYGFEFKFPGDLYLKDYGSEYGIVMYNEELPEKLPPGDNPYSLKVFPRKDNIYDLSSTHFSDFISKKSFKINGHDAIKISYHSDMLDRDSYTYYIQINDWAITMTGTIKEDVLIQVMKALN